jgi:hypothetical protein
MRITEEELVALLGSVPGQLQPAVSVERTRLADAGVNAWFKYRMAFLLAVAATYTTKLLFFPALIAANFSLAASAISLDQYVQYRAGFVLLISSVYLYSYLKNCQFEKVALVFLGVGAMALVVDYFSAYVYLSQTPTQWIAGLMASRFLAVLCLSINAMNARHAPRMPRHLWS